VALVAVSLLLWPVAATGWLYPVAATVLGAVFVAQAVLMWRRSVGTEELSRIRPMELFHSSNLYLSLLFVAVALDPLVTR
jgi:protoheme IX farnesyltransferase